nr:p6 protein [Sugarcane mild mosaic virus]
MRRFIKKSFGLLVEVVMFGIQQGIDTSVGFAIVVVVFLILIILAITIIVCVYHVSRRLSIAPAAAPRPDF